MSPQQGSTLFPGGLLVILYDLLKEGVTILFSTSYLDEAERCSRVGFIHRGELLVADPPSASKQDQRGDSGNCV